VTGALEQVLQLVADGRLTADEAAPILAALDEPEGGGTADRAGTGFHPDPGGAPDATGAASSIRIQVRDGGRSVVNLRLPLGLGRFAIDRVPGLATTEVETVREALRLGLRGSILEVTEPDGDGVSIVLE
jgi:hypothetical protein